MAVLSRATFADRLASLSAAGLRALVADVWTARGYEVRVTESAVVALRKERRTTIVPVVSRRFRGPARPPSGVDPDVVVDGSGSEAGRTVAVDHGAAYVGPDDLYDCLLYGLDRDTGERLLDRHLDLSLYVARAAGSDRRVSGTEESGDGELGGRRSALSPARSLLPGRRELTTATAVVVAVGVALALVVGPGTVSRLVADGGPEAAPSAASAAENTTTADDAGALGALDAPAGYPPGVAEGRVDGDRLAAAHERALANRSYHWRSRFVTPEPFVDGFGWDETVSEQVVENESRYRESTLSRRRLDGGGVERFAIDVYSDRDGRYRRLRPPDRDVEYGVFDVTTDRPRSLAWRVEQFLGGGDVTVHRIGTGAERRYRVIVRDVPASRLNAAPSELRYYRAAAVVRPNGLVVSMNVSYVRSVEGRDGTYRYRYRYVAIGNVTVSEPGWVERARENESRRP